MQNDGNIGNHNFGADNTGKCNVGDDNVGKCNVGQFNKGNLNKGSRNVGFENIGACNIGSGNRGNFNVGNHNFGEFNLTDCAVGDFNTEPQKIYLFNRPTDWTQEDWNNNEARGILRDLAAYSTNWIDEDSMSDAKKREHPEYETTHGYLKVLTREEWLAHNARNWKALSSKDKRIVMSLPNFDAGIFKKITGIDVTVEQ